MVTSARRSSLVGDHVRSAVDTETHLNVAHELTNKGFDRDQLAQMAKAAKDALNRDALHVIAHKEYFSSPEILAAYTFGPKLPFIDDLTLCGAARIADGVDGSCSTGVAMRHNAVVYHC